MLPALWVEKSRRIGDTPSTIVCAPCEFNATDTTKSSVRLLVRRVD